MGIRTSSIAAWIGLTALTALAVSIASLPKTRSSLTIVALRILEMMDRGIESLQMRLQTSFGRRMAALEEISQTLDAATSQYESSMTVSKVAEALSEDPILKGKKVGVRIIGGILHLEGEVDSQHEKMRAAEVARRASGAELVANDLKVTSRS